MRGTDLKRLRVAVVAAVAIIVLGAAPASAQGTGGTGSANDLRYRLSVIDAELADIRARMGLPAINAAAPGGTSARPGATAGSADAMLRLDRLEAEIRQLTGKIEKIEFAQRAIAEDAARRFTDVEYRLTELEGGDISKVARIPALGSTAETQAAAAGPAVSISERADLDRAIEDVQQGRFDLGEDRLRSFLNDYPGSPLIGEALYWQGQSQFVRGNFQAAARSFLDGYKSDRASPSAPKNLLRLGVTLGRLGQVNEACQTLREVRRQFPAAPAEVLQSADDEAAGLSCG